LVSRAASRACSCCVPARHKLPAATPEQAGEPAARAARHVRTHQRGCAGGAAPR
jgi:hypothetical protein